MYYKWNKGFRYKGYTQPIIKFKFKYERLRSAKRVSLWFSGEICLECYPATRRAL